MGTDKALLRLATSETLLDRALALVASVTPEVRLLAPRGRYASLTWSGPVVEDIYPDRGPLAGIHAALSSTSTDLNLIFAVDMPAMTPACLRYLIDRAEKSPAQVTMPDVDGRQQPLCAVYRRSLCDTIRDALEAGKNKIRAAIPPDQIMTVTDTELAAAGFGPELFRNLNTGDEWSAFNDRIAPQT